MAKIHDTIVLPEGCGPPSLSGLLGIEPANFDEDQEPLKSFFGPEFDAMSEDFQRKHVDPLRRADYFLRTSGKLKELHSK